MKSIQQMLTDRKYTTVSFWRVILILLYCAAFIPNTFAIPMAGAYTINSAVPSGGTNFMTFADFASTINTDGISANVVVSVMQGSGPYTEQININTIAGASSSAKLTIEGNGELLKGVTTSTTRHVLRLSNCQHVTINNLRISRDPSSTGGFLGIHLFNTGSFINITNCEVDMSGTTSTLYGGVVASGSLTSILTTGEFHNIIVDGNTFNGGGYGVSVFGLVSNLSTGIRITNNVITNATSNGIYLRETNGAVVSANTIDKSANYTVSCNAIQLAQAANINARIFNNIISVTATTNGTSTIRGIYLFNGTGHKVYNNLIHNILLTTGNFKAIEVRTAATAPEIFFNTISLDNSVSTSGNLTGFSEELSNTKSVLRDNLISITQTVTGTGYKAGILLASTSSVDTAISSNYNSIYVSGGSVARKGTTTATNYLTLANWQTASGEDMNSVAINPGFASLVNSVPTNVAMNNMGTSISWITTDITGAVRASTPDIGAYEFTGGAPSAPDSILGSNKVCENTAAVNYSVVPVPGAASYTWTVTGATLVSGQGTASIMIDFSNTAAMISVLASNVNGSSASVSKPVSIAALPNTNFVASPENFCETWGQVNLGGGLPSGGTYSGNAVFNNQFNPVVAGLGPQIITYSYTNSDGCTASAEDTVHVVVCTNISPVQHTPKIVFENPCLAPCTVNLDGFSSGVLVNLYSAQGILVESQQVTSSFELKQHHNPGVYFLEIVNGTGGRIVQKIVL